MKKQWMQMTSLVLNCVLILLAFWQGARLENLERQTDDGQGDLERRLDMGLEEAKKQGTEAAPTVRFAQVRVDAASRMLTCLLYTSPSPRDMRRSRMPSSA